MSGPRLLTLAEVDAWERLVRIAIPRNTLAHSEDLDRMLATLRNGAFDRKREDVAAIEREAAGVARFLLDQARR